MGKISDLEWARQCFYNPKLKQGTGAIYAYNHLSYRDQKKLKKAIPLPFHKYLYIENALPETVHSFFTKVSFVPEKELIGLGCLVQQLIPYRKEINSYVQLKEQYEAAFLLGEYDKCKGLLDEIDNICLSIWSLENRFLLKNCCKGTEDALAYKDEIADKSSPLATILMTLLWSKIEAKYSLAPLEQKLNLTLRSFGFSDQASAFYKYKTLKEKGKYKFLDCIIFALMTSVIDMYEFVLDMIIAMSDEFTGDDFCQIRTMLADLGKQIEDRRLNKLNAFWNFSPKSKDPKTHIELLELYKSGNYKKVKELAPSYLSQFPDDFDIVDVYVKSCIFLGNKDINTSFYPQKSYAEQITRHLFHYLKKDVLAQMSFSRLEVIANQMTSLRIGNCLYEKLKTYEDSYSVLRKYELYDSFTEISGMDTIGDDCYQMISGDIPVFLKQKAVGLTFEKLEKERKDSDLICLYNQAFFVNPMIISKINAKALLERHDKVLNILSLDPLETCVFYAVVGAPKHMIYHFFKKYIKAQKTQIPSELVLENAHNFTPLLETFFYMVCTQDILKLYIRKFPTSDSVLEERLKLLTNLSKIQGKNRYLAEITRIKRKQLTNKRVQDLDQRMIFVDENAIKDKELAEVEKQFHVYTETESTLETKQYMIEAEGISVDKINQGEMKVKTEKVIYKNLLFRQMFLDVRRLFLTSYNNGLDFYLSTRIRHGTLLTQLRSAFEENNLVTNKQDGAYKENSIIADRVLGLSGEQRAKVVERLKVFSKEIDDYILHIKDDIVQVQALDLPVQYPQAIFNYDVVITENDIALLYLDKMSQIDDYVEFIEVIFSYLWEKTEFLLEAMREFLDNVKLSMAGKIITLENDIIGIVGENNRLDGFVEKSKNARDGMMQSVENVKKWFYRGKCDDDDFQIRDVVDACKESVSIHRNTTFAPTVNDDSETWIKGEYFRKISDLYLIFFNNILDYQNEAKMDANCVVDICEDENLIEVTISNSLAESDVDKRKQYIEDMKPKLGNPKFYRYASKEKGSGHFKAYNMIHSMLPYDQSAFLLDVQDDKFIVKFKIDTTYIKADENPNS